MCFSDSAQAAICSPRSFVVSFPFFSINLKRPKPTVARALLLLRGCGAASSGNFRWSFSRTSVVYCSHSLSAAAAAWVARWVQAEAAADFCCVYERS